MKKLTLFIMPALKTLFFALAVNSTILCSGAEKCLGAETINRLISTKNFGLIVALLQDNKIDPLTTLDDEKNTLIHWVASTNDHENALKIARTILAKHVNLNSKNLKENTPLHCAADCDSKHEITTLLLQAGANPNIQNTYKRIPLYNAFYYVCPKNAALLLQKGGDLDLKDKEKKTPRNWMYLELSQYNKGATTFLKTLIPFKAFNKKNGNFYTPKWLFIQFCAYSIYKKPKPNIYPASVVKKGSYQDSIASENPALAGLGMKFIQFYFGPRKKIIFPNTAPKNDEYPALTKEEELTRKELFTKTFYQLAVERDHHGLSNREFRVFTNLEQLTKTNKLRDLKINFWK